MEKHEMKLLNTFAWYVSKGNNKELAIVDGDYAKCQVTSQNAFAIGVGEAGYPECH